MRDIRSDLKERLEVLAERQTALKKLQDALEVERAALVNLYELESRRYEAKASETPNEHMLGAGFRRLKPIASFIDELLDAGPLTKEDLREKSEEAGYFKGEEAAGRVLHATLMNLERHGRIKLREDGKYEIFRRPLQLSAADLKLPSGVRGGGL